MVARATDAQEREKKKTEHVGIGIGIFFVRRGVFVKRDTAADVPSFRRRPVITRGTLAGEFP